MDEGPAIEGTQESPVLVEPTPSSENADNTLSFWDTVGQFDILALLPPEPTGQRSDSFLQQESFAKYNQNKPKHNYNRNPPPQPNYHAQNKHEKHNKDYSKQNKIAHREASNQRATTNAESRNFTGTPPSHYRNRFRQFCFNGEAPVHMFNGETKNIKDLKIGDILLSTDSNPTTIKKIKKTEYFRMRDMVEFDDFLITKGHPIFINNDWYRPDELFELKSYFIEILYNVYCEPFHEIFVGIKRKIMCTSLGGWCPRIAKLDPYTDILYGSGYGSELSKRYEWLLTIEKRIPDEKVEEETDKYWARQNQKEIEVYKKKTEHDRKRAVQETERKEKRGKGNYFL